MKTDNVFQLELLVAWVLKNKQCPGSHSHTSHHETQEKLPVHMFELPAAALCLLPVTPASLPSEGPASAQANLVQNEVGCVLCLSCCFLLPPSLCSAPISQLRQRTATLPTLPPWEWRRAHLSTLPSFSPLHQVLGILPEKRLSFIFLRLQT